MRKRILVAAISIVMAFVFAACASNGPATEEETTAPAAEEEEAAPVEETASPAPTPEYTNFSYVMEVSSETGFGMDVNSVLLTPEGQAVMRTEGELGEQVGWEVQIGDGVKDIFVEPFGDEGLFAIIMVKEDGTVSEVNASALVNELTVEVQDNLGGYEDVQSIESVQSADSYSVNAVSSSGDELPLDEYLK